PGEAADGTARVQRARVERGAGDRGDVVHAEVEEPSRQVVGDRRRREPGVRLLNVVEVRLIRGRDQRLHVDGVGEHAVAIRLVRVGHIQVHAAGQEEGGREDYAC